MNFNELNKDNFLLFSIKHYENPNSSTQEEFQDLLQTIDYAKSDDYFKAVPRGDVNVVVRGLSTMPKTGLYNLIKSVYQENHPKLKANAFKAISGIFHDANEEIVNTLKASELKKQRKSTLDATDFVTDMDELVTFYAELSDEQKKLALKNSLGYMDTFQFSLNRSQSTDPEPPIATENLGVITIGGKEVEKMLTRIASILDKEIFAVFTSLKTLSDSLNGFFAGGLADDGKALEAIGSAQEIEKKTTELQSDK